MKKIIILLPVFFLLFEGCKKGENPAPKVVQNPIPGVDNMMTNWMNQNNFPGAELGVSLNGNLVYKKGYGMADVENKDTVTADSRFRIASVSKLFTSACVLKLVQDGKLNINQQVFGPNGVLGTTYGTQPYGQWITDITVNDLLHHTVGGWGQSTGNDVAFYNPETWDETTLINWVLNNVPLATQPGTNFDYSNFGYMLLAKIVEVVSGESYPQYFKDQFLSKLNANNTTIADSSLAGRQPGEVKYYGQGGDVGYVYNFVPFVRDEGAMGWVTNVSDMLRFANSVDSSNRPNILNKQTLALMTTTSAASTGLGGFPFGCGWVVVGDGEWFWWGSLPGTFGFLYRNVNGICIAALANSRAVNSVNGLNSFINVVNYIAFTNTIPWQNINQFQQ